MSSVRQNNRPYLKWAPIYAVLLSLYSKVNLK